MDRNTEIKELVIARLSTFPSNKRVYIKDYGELTREDMIKHVSEEDEIGKKIIEIELAYLRALKNLI